ncbi:MULTISPECIES: flagellar hook-associated protein 2 [Virgibacillus]|uniref:flagellar hook-associated protein 2 n=1 Tax=Virgibacillus TaxID=84406 RepID=UPI000388948C|nr:MULTISPECIES: flagellar hook-associated protein 2 [Virgibacillus]EQB37475.1 hypothetical protein M948_02720 [Virgibacillus sp. CM-4]MYL40227.1 flagellar hook-associated protein 2 [Virgibacillus massiliensis]
MRIGGLATGMDIDNLVNKLMSAERIPLDKMEQERTTLEWKRDAFREVNTKLSELEALMFDMKLSPTYNAKTVSSSHEDAVTATASTSTANGTYQINVKELATNAINVSAEEIDASAISAGQEITFSTVDENGEANEYTYTVEEGETLTEVLKRVSADDNNVRMFYDEQTNKVIMETSRTGNYNERGAEIQFTANSFFSSVLKMNMDNEKGGTNAKFEYNNSGLEMESKTNAYSLNGINFEFKNTTNDSNATLTVINDVEGSFQSIMKFVDKYNEVVEALNSSQKEEKYRDYPPLTEEQKKEMSDKEIELWEEKAKSGLLRGESTISSGLFDLRQSWYSNVDTGGEYNSITQVGMKTSSNYLDGGKLIVDEQELKKALRENPADVQKLFSNNEEGASRGIIHRLDDALSTTIGRIGEKAGSTGQTLENYSLGKRMKDLNTRISDFENRLVQVESRYWNQFTAMEKAISRMNQQSAQLMSQFGSGM